MNSNNTASADPIHDHERLQEIADLDLFSDEVQGILDDMTERSAKRFNLPIGLVSLVLDEAQYFASKFGIDEGWIADANGTPVEWSFCRFAVQDRDAFIVEDAANDERVKNNPLVEQDGIRCYAGIPLITSKGHAIGSFCVIGPEERHFEESEIAELRVMAKEVVRRIERRVGRDV